MKIATVIAASFVASVLSSISLAADPPWTTNSPIAEVTRELYAKHPKPKTAIMTDIDYVGPDLEMKETRMWEAVSDTPEKPVCRYSADNGETWTDFEPREEVVSHVGGKEIIWCPGPTLFDPASGTLVSVWLRQTRLGSNQFRNHCFCRLSPDGARTWSEPQLMRYEPGADFDPENPLDPEFLEHNQAYFGQNLIERSTDGALVFSVVTANIPKDAPDPNPRKVSAFYVPVDCRSIGGVNFVGKWNADEKRYDWTAGNVVWVPRHVSSRGLMEPGITELKDGRILTVWRSSNQSLDRSEQPGRKLFALSTDGGFTMSQPAEWKYDDGSSFYSPSSIHRFLRHSVTGKLYWVGNISPSPCNGNSPRYPLIIAEVDEAKAALKKDTVTLIDTRREGDGPGVQLSNFSLFENRKTHDVEIYLTRLGEDASCVWNADAYKYVLRLK